MEFSMRNADDEDNDEDGAGDDEDGGADPEQLEDAAKLKKQKQDRGARKAILQKFKQEILQRTLLPVLGSVYRQVRNLTEAPELATAAVRLVAALAKQAEIDLAGEKMFDFFASLLIVFNFMFIN